jgi:ATP-dependent DNA helicase RecQ
LVQAAREVLQRYWGYSAFRPAQEAVIQALLAGREVVALLPTGGGKSLCYQVPGLVLGGVTIVVSPLIALMRDQVEGLLRRGIPAAAIDSSLPTPLREKILHQAQAGQLSFLYVAPERVTTAAFLEKIQPLPVRLIAIDEAHCISQWGHDFRASYLRLAELRATFPQALWIALTATATPRVRQDILTYLQLQNPVVVQQPFYRPNFYYAVVHDIDKDKRLFQSLQKLHGSGIIYVSSRKRAQEVAEKLRRWGISAAFYHAGMPASARNETQAAWIREKIRVIVATSAFGMGIDKPNTRFVIHYDLAIEPEAYFQEVGRAGRDGELAYAVALLAPRDLEEVWNRLEEKYPPHEVLLRLYELLRQRGGIGAPFPINPTELTEQLRIKSYTLWRALHLLSQEGFLSWREGHTTRAYVRSRVAPEAWQKPITPLQGWIARLGGAALFTEGAYVDLLDWAYQLGIPYTQLYEEIERLRREGWLIHDALPPNFGEVLLQEPPPSPTQWETLRHKYRTLQQQARVRATFMLRYYQQTAVCRAQYLLRYFEELIEPCGQCDVCRGYYAPNRPTESEKMQAAAWLSEYAQVPRPPHELKEAILRLFPQKAEALLEGFLAEGRLELLPDWRLRWKK